MKTLDGMRWIHEQLDDRATREVLVARDPLDHIGHRQMQLIDRELTRAVDRHECAASPHERVDLPHALRTNTTRIPRRNRARRKTIDDLSRSYVG